MKIFASEDKKRAILVNDDFDGIEASYGFHNVLVCDPAGLIETEELHETDEQFDWTEVPR